MSSIFHRAGRVGRMGAYGMLLAALLFVLASCSGSQPADTATGEGPVQVTLSTNVLHVGDLFHTDVAITHPPASRVEAPELRRGKDVIVRNQRAETYEEQDQLVTAIRYDMTSFELGEHLVSSNPVVVVHSDGTTTETPFPAASFTVQSILTAEEPEMRDIKGLASWPGRVPAWVFAVLALVLLGAVAAVVARRFLARSATGAPAVPPTPPHEVALRALKGLLSRGWIEKDAVEPFYVELSSIVRRYIEDRFGLRAPERTTEEFIREASRSRALSYDHQDLTRGFLEQSDLVKFARHHPQPDDMHAAYDAAERLVIETKPPEAGGDSSGSPGANHQPSTINHSP